MSYIDRRKLSSTQPLSGGLPYPLSRRTPLRIDLNGDRVNMLFEKFIRFKGTLDFTLNVLLLTGGCGAARLRAGVS